MRFTTAVLVVIVAFGAGALFGFSRRPPLGTLPPWMIEKIKERSRRDDCPRETVPLPPPPSPPDEEEDSVVIDYSEDEE